MTDRSDLGIIGSYAMPLEQGWEEYCDFADIDEMDLEFLNDNRKTSGVFPRFGKITIIFLLIFIIASSAVLFLNSESSYRVRGAVQNLKHFFAPEKEPTMDESGIKELKIRSWENVKNGKDLVDKFCLPGYIPEGYVFQEAYFSREDSVSSTSGTLYTYRKGKKELLIFIDTLKGGEWDMYLSGEPYIDPESGRTLYLLEEEEDGTLTTDYITNDTEAIYSIGVSGWLTKEENAKIINNLKEIK